MGEVVGRLCKFCAGFAKACAGRFLWWQSAMPGTFCTKCAALGDSGAQEVSFGLRLGLRGNFGNLCNKCSGIFFAHCGATRIFFRDAPIFCTKCAVFDLCGGASLFLRASGAEATFCTKCAGCDGLSGALLFWVGRLSLLGAIDVGGELLFLFDLGGAGRRVSGLVLVRKETREMGREELARWRSRERCGRPGVKEEGDRIASFPVMSRRIQFSADGVTGKEGEPGKVGHFVWKAVQLGAMKRVTRASFCRNFRASSGESLDGAVSRLEPFHRANPGRRQRRVEAMGDRNA
jgi:hypothetical protein